MAPPELIFGTGFISEAFSSVEGASTLLGALREAGIEHIDTARLYPAISPGDAEKLLGKVKAAEKGFRIDTKIKVPPTFDTRGTGKKEAVDSSVEESFAELGVKQVNILYLHAPDPTTPFEETAAAMNEHFKKGEFKKLGVANFTADMLEEFLDICEEKGFVKPSVFQGQYNAVCRRPEQDLMPLLRKHGIAFYAYSPLAGGFLTGKLSSGDELDGTRFEEGNMMGAFFRSMYDKPEIHAAVQKVQGLIQPRGITLPAASLRWLLHHSALGPDDGVILGASKLSHLHDNTAAIAAGPLPDEVGQAMEDMWKAVESVAP